MCTSARACACVCVPSPEERTPVASRSTNGLKLVLTCLLSTIRFVELNLLSTTTSKQVIMPCKSQFACHSKSDRLITDNGPQFSSDNFKKFVLDYSFDH